MEANTLPQEKADLEERKIALEEKKLDIEIEKLKIEKTKAWAGNFSIFLSVLIGAGTISFGIWSQHQQAQTQFELKAAELVMSTEHPSVTRNKAKALLTLFPDRLPKNFAESFIKPPTNEYKDPEPELEITPDSKKSPTLEK